MLYGGTGTDTFNLNQPLDMPEGFEAGTLNLPAVASLYEGVTFLKNHGRNFHSRLIDASEYLINALNKIDGSTCFSAPNPRRHSFLFPKKLAKCRSKRPF